MCRCTCEIELKCGNSLLYNDPELSELARKVATRIVGADIVYTKDVAVMGGDDFAEFLQYGPGFYFFVGMQDEESGVGEDHHHPGFRVHEDALPLGMEMLMELVTEYLGK